MIMQKKQDRRRRRQEMRSAPNPTRIRHESPPPSEPYYNKDVSPKGSYYGGNSRQGGDIPQSASSHHGHQSSFSSYGQQPRYPDQHPPSSKPRNRRINNENAMDRGQSNVGVCIYLHLNIVAFTRFV